MQICNANSSSSVTKFVQNTNGFIHGLSAATSQCSSGVQGADVQITSNGNTYTTQSGSDGTYALSLCDDSSYELCVTNTCSDACGLSDIDLPLFREYILGIKPWDKSTILRGDVDRSGSANTLDLAFIQKKILGYTVNNVSSWCRFVPVHDYSDNYTLNHAYWNTIDSCITISSNSTSKDFIRFAMGDINGSCNDCVHHDGSGPYNYSSSPETPIATASIQHAEDKISMRGGEKYCPVLLQPRKNNTLEVKLPVEDLIYSMSLHFDLPKGAKIKDVVSPLPKLLYRVYDDRLHISWVDLTEDDKGYKTRKAASLVTITYEGAALPEYNINQENYVLGIKTGLKKLMPKGKIGIRSDNNTVNIANLTNVQLVGKEDVSIYMYDMQGNLVLTRSAATDVGYIDLDTNGLTKGLYVIRLYNADNDVSRKVFITE